MKELYECRFCATQKNLAEMTIPEEESVRLRRSNDSPHSSIDYDEGMLYCGTYRCDVC